MPPTARPANATDPVHDFTGKLRQPALYGRVLDYVAWQRSARAATLRETMPAGGPACGATSSPNCKSRSSTPSTTRSASVCSPPR